MSTEPCFIGISSKPVRLPGLQDLGSRALVHHRHCRQKKRHSAHSPGPAVQKGPLCLHNATPTTNTRHNGTTCNTAVIQLVHGIWIQTPPQTTATESCPAAAGSLSDCRTLPDAAGCWVLPVAAAVALSSSAARALFCMNLLIMSRLAAGWSIGTMWPCKCITAVVFSRVDVSRRPGWATDCGHSHASRSDKAASFLHTTNTTTAAPRPTQKVDAGAHRLVDLDKAEGIKGCDLANLLATKLPGLVLRLGPALGATPLHMDTDR